MRASADISNCGRYRWHLSRQWAKGPLLTFVMLNPSTADAQEDDPTIRRCISFGRREGFAGISVVNLFPYRATDPQEIPSNNYPKGTEFEVKVLDNEILSSAKVICAWGSARIAKRRAKWFSHRYSYRELFCLGKTKDGSPRHPLYLPGDAAILPWP